MSVAVSHQCCPACNAKCDENVIACKSCGFMDNLGITAFWVDTEDATAWLDAVIRLRMIHEIQSIRKQQAEFSVKIDSIGLKLNQAQNEISLVSQQYIGRHFEDIKYILNTLEESINITNEHKGAYQTSQQYFSQQLEHIQHTLSDIIRISLKNADLCRCGGVRYSTNTGVRRCLECGKEKM